MKTLVVIPTYDERDNVAPMAAAVLKNLPPEGEVLFVDDNSPDGTGGVLDGLCAAEPRVHVLHRVKKDGLGRAYVAGFTWALDHGAEFVAQMDCDFSHDPAALPSLLTAAADNDLVVGSRYVSGGATVNWPLRRRLISRLGGLVVRVVTGMPLRDPTGGFRVFRRRALEEIGVERIESNGYSFQLETNHRAWMAGLRLTEIPITFAERRAGYSKITAGIAVESLKMVFRLWLRAGLRRRPGAASKGAGI